MLDSRDPAIKLFGKTIPLPSSGEEGGEEGKGFPNIEATPEFRDKEQESLNSEEKNEPISSMADETEKPSSNDQENASEKNSKPEEQQNDSSNPQEKPLKKPDKILPCPRCNSLDTKFCYYNNYNVNQPRHFCKNCQRYWTAGGSMRNVPVGAGRRKNKNSTASHYRHITVSDATLQAIPDPIYHPPLKPNGTVLSFGSDTPLCETMASVLNLTEKTMKNCHPNGFHRKEEQMEERSSGSSVSASNSNDEGTGANLQEPMTRNCQGFAPQIPYLNGSPWPYPWNPPPAFCAPSFPIPFYPATAYWGCSTWSIPWLSPLATSSPTSGSSGSGPNSPSLGKHSREGDVLLSNTNSKKGDRVKQSNQERSLWIPKTLRIGDPEEAAKSSIWATMGFKNDKSDTISAGGGFFKAFQTKAELKNHTADASQVLHANPAALSRSINFQEST